MRKFLIKILRKLVWSEFKQEYTIADKVAVEKWLFDSYKEKGALDYLKVEEFKILKNMARGLTPEMYWKEIGKREQIAMLFNDMQKAFELRKAADAKRVAEEKRKGGVLNEKQVAETA